MQTTPFESFSRRYGKEGLRRYVGRDEVESFAEWAFGPDGLPELRVFAYGDFAFPNEEGSEM